MAKRDLLPGSVLAAVLFQVLQSFGYGYVAGVIKNASATNAVFAVVLGLLAYLYLASMIVVFCMELNVVRRDRLWPRALLTPFTDNVDLTAADEHTYARQAQAQRLKGFETINVEFGESPKQQAREVQDRTRSRRARPTGVARPRGWLDRAARARRTPGAQ